MIGTRNLLTKSGIPSFIFTITFPLLYQAIPLLKGIQPAETARRPSDSAPIMTFKCFKPGNSLSQRIYPLFREDRRITSNNNDWSRGAYE
jgi:hypothetical protein